MIFLIFFILFAQIINGFQVYSKTKASTYSVEFPGEEEEEELERSGANLCKGIFLLPGITLCLIQCGKVCKDGDCECKSSTMSGISEVPSINPFDKTTGLQQTTNTNGLSSTDPPQSEILYTLSENSAKPRKKKSTVAFFPKPTKRSVSGKVVSFIQLNNQVWGMSIS